MDEKGEIPTPGGLRGGDVPYGDKVSLIFNN